MRIVLIILGVLFLICAGIGGCALHYLYSPPPLSSLRGPVTGLTWSGDSRRLAFSVVHVPSTWVCIVSADGKAKPTWLRVGTGFVMSSPALNRDGSQVALGTFGAVLGPGKSALEVLSASAKKPLRLGASAMTEACVWSPDGKYIGYFGMSLGQMMRGGVAPYGGCVLGIADPATGSVQEYPVSSVMAMLGALWCTEDSQLFVVAGQGPGQAQVAWCDVASSKITQAALPGLGGGIAFGHPARSDGELLIPAQDSTARWQIFRVSLEDGSLKGSTLLSNLGFVSATQVAVIGDGDVAVVQGAATGGQTDVHVVGLPDKRVLRALKVVNPVGHFVVSPDAKKVAIPCRDGLWVYNLDGSGKQRVAAWPSGTTVFQP